MCDRMNLSLRVREYWRSLKRGRPGRRFQDRYERSAEARNRQHVAWRIAKVIAGLVAIAIGVVEILLPGPAVLFFFVGGALLASESRAVARAMDWGERRGRSLWRFVRRTARGRHHPPTLVILTAGAAALAEAAGNPPWWG